MEEPMIFLPGIRDWARRLIASESSVDPLSAQSEPAALRVYEKLRSRLCAPIGVGGFQALASRALSLTKLQYPKLGELQVTAGGILYGPGKINVQMAVNEDVEVGIIFIAQLLEVFLTLLGEATITRLIADAGPQLEVNISSRSAGTIVPQTDISYLEPFENLLLEAERLRDMSKRLETLVDKHNGMNGMMNLAENIRSIATVLDVFTLIRSKAGNLQDDTDSASTTGYVN